MQSTLESVFKRFKSELDEEQEPEASFWWALAEIHGWTKTEARVQWQIPLGDEQAERWQTCLSRIKNNEPIQYIFGKAFFCGLEMEVGPEVLIPRPETEELVEWILNRHGSDPHNVLDLCAGSGCIALALKHHRPSWRVSGSDVSASAVALAQKNSRQLGLDVCFEVADLFAQTIPDGTDILVSNPPYIPKSLSQNLATRVLKFEPHLALFSPEDDPFVFFRRIAALGTVANVKYIYFETHATDIPELIAILKEHWEGAIIWHNDISGKPRFLALELRP